MQMTHAVAGVAALILTTQVASATTLVLMNLADLSSQAGSIFRGRIVAVDTGTLQAGGGTIPTITYSFTVTDMLKGDVAIEDDAKYAVVQMIDPARGAARKDGVQRVSLFSDLPILECGREYLLFTTAPSRIGLSTAVGFGQGVFRIEGEGGQATVINAYGNAGLLDRMPGAAARAARPAAGPIAYADFATRVRALVGRRGGAR